MTQTYQYDDLFRLMHADGTYQRDEDNTDTYTNDFTYDTINNMLTKNQVHEIDHPSDGSISPRPQTTYDYSYDYGWTIKDTGSLHNGAIAPHIASHIGGKTYKYDRNGNMTKWIDDQTKREMDLTWDDENRLMSTEEQGKLTLYRYDDAGTRVIKRGKNGEVLYVNPDYSLRNGEVGSKHIFAGNTRIATKLTMKEQKLNASKATYDKSLGGHNGRVPEKSRGNHFGWGDTIGTGTSAHGNAYGHDKQAERRAPENHGQLMKLEKASDNAETTKGKGKSKNNGNANANAKSQGNANPHDYKYDTDLPGKSEKGLENALSHGKGHKYGIYKRLARRGLIVNSAGDIVPIGSSGDDVSGETGDDSVTTPTVGNATGAVPEELGIYYYQGDHLGSSNIITDRTGRVYEHLEYFPYGETWVDEQRNKTNLPYQFTGKELDPETGMYYYGARYYEPVTSRWISADPMLSKYLPKGSKEKNRKLPGMGGVYRPININLYRYAGQNPLNIFDSDGRSDVYDQEGNHIRRVNDNQNTVKIQLSKMKTKNRYLGADFVWLNKKQSKLFNEYVGTVAAESSGDKLESAAIADVINNRVKHSGKSFTNILHNTGVVGNASAETGDVIRTSDDPSIRNARAGVIDVFLGGKDDSQGAYFWEGLSYLQSPTNYFHIRLNTNPPIFNEIFRAGLDVGGNNGTIFMNYNSDNPTYGRNVWP